MYSVTPKKQNKLTELSCLACFVCGVGIFAVSIINTSIPYLSLAAQLVGVLIVTAGIYLYSKYIARTFTYSVQPGGIYDADGRELYDLVVLETVGSRKQRTVCRIALRDIVQVRACPMNTVRQSGQRFTYCVDLVPQRVLEICDVDKNVVVLTYDARLYEILSPNY